MQCLIPSQNMRILVRALHSLSRIGDDIYIESPEEGLCFRTVNTAQSAYSSVMFYAPFFVCYKSDFKTDEGGKCKLSMKALLSVFKTPHSMDRNVDSGQIAIDEQCVRVSFQIRFHQGYTKNYYLAVCDNTNVQLKYNKDEMCNKMSILSKTLFGAIKHFRANDDEITLSVKTDKASLRNYFQDLEANCQKVVRTNLSLQPSEFENYEINLPGSITFTLREIKAVCTFSELSNSSPVSIIFEKAGKPVIFSVRNEQLYEADYVVSTLPPDMVSGERPHRRSQLSDVVSTVPSTTSGVTAGNKKQKLAPVAEEQEPIPSPVPRVSLVDIIRDSNEFGQSPARNENTPAKSPTVNCNLRKSVRNDSVRPLVAKCVSNANNTRDPGQNNSLQPSIANCVSNASNTHELVQNKSPLPSVTNCVPPQPDDMNFFPEDVNNECFEMVCDKVDELTRSQINRIHIVFQHCYDYSPKSLIISEDEILCDASDTSIG